MQRHRGSMLCIKEQSGDCGCMQGGWGGGRVLRGLVIVAAVWQKLLSRWASLVPNGLEMSPRGTNGVLRGGSWWQSFLCFHSTGVMQCLW